MSNIADEIIQRGDSNGPSTRPTIFNLKSDGKTDELGIPISDIDDYFVARVLYLDANEPVMGGRLYVKDGKIYAGREEVVENRQNLYKVARWCHPLKDHQVQWLWARIKEFLPELDDSKLIVGPGVLWDRETGELRFEDPDSMVGI